MKRIIGIAVTLMLCMILASCGKKYKIKYVGIDEGDNKEEEIRAANDTLAYIEAYRNFCIAKKVEKDMIEEFGGKEEIKEFRLYKENGEDITGIEFTTKAEVEKKEYEQINKLGNVVSDGKTTIKRDSVKIKELEPFFKYEEDEFDVQKKKWVKPKGVPKYVNQNTIYFYFASNEKQVSKLRLRFQYVDSKWLFIKKYIFNIDDFPIEFTPVEVRRDNEGGMIWEWSDDEMTPFEANLVELIENCKSIKVKIIGDDYSKVKTISSKEIEAMKKTIELYKAMGGSI